MANNLVFMSLENIIYITYNHIRFSQRFSCLSAGNIRVSYSSLSTESQFCLNLLDVGSVSAWGFLDVLKIGLYCKSIAAWLYKIL